MPKLLIIAKEPGIQEEVRKSFSHNGFVFSTASISDELLEQVADESPVLVLADVNVPAVDSGIFEVIRRIKKEMNLPVIALIAGEMLNSEPMRQGAVDDFVVKPYHPRELVLRVKRVLHLMERKNDTECIVCGDLLIDSSRCEVTLSGRVIVLTFMEYELLRFLAGNKGRVFTRDAILNKVWGYDYYGGDRTVDVHIRRLRSKIEDMSHTFIETVRNIGYRFRDNGEISVT